jgi:hypothetical protein
VHALDTLKTRRKKHNRTTPTAGRKRLNSHTNTNNEIQLHCRVSSLFRCLFHYSMSLFVPLQHVADNGSCEVDVFGSFDGQLVTRVVVNHVGNVLKRLTELPQNVLAISTHNLHVHKPSHVSETTHNSPTN